MKDIFFVCIFSFLLAADPRPSPQLISDADRMTDCKFGRADFNPLKSDTKDYEFEYDQLTLHFHDYTNFCRKAIKTCHGESGIMIFERNNDCTVYPASWEDMTMTETSYE